jgi:hypothetical protein
MSPRRRAGTIRAVQGLNPWRRLRKVEACARLHRWKIDCRLPKLGDLLLNELGIADNTIVVVTTDNGAEGFSWPDGGTTPFKGWKGMGTEGGFRVPAVIRWPGKVKPNQVINEVMSGLDWFPTFVTAAGYEGDIVEDLKNGKRLNGKEYKVHLDGYNQMDMLTKGAKSAREEVWYFTESTLAAVRIGNYNCNGHIMPRFVILLARYKQFTGSRVYRLECRAKTLRDSVSESLLCPLGLPVCITQRAAEMSPAARSSGRD